MTIHVKPHLEAVLKAEVDAGNFSNVEEALEAAIMSLHTDIDDGDIAWMKQFADEAEADVAAHGTLSHKEVWADLRRRRAKKRATR